MEFSEESLTEAATAFARIEGFVRRAAEQVGPGELGEVPEAFATAMDDDLGVPAALAVLQGVIADGNKIVSGVDTAALPGVLASVRAMLDVLGLDPLAPTWDRGGDDAAYAQVIDSSWAGCSNSAKRRGPTRTSLPRTEFATSSRPPASTSRTRRRVRAGP